MTMYGDNILWQCTVYCDTVLCRCTVAVYCGSGLWQYTVRVYNVLWHCTMTMHCDGTQCTVPVFYHSTVPVGLFSLCYHCIHVPICPVYHMKETGWVKVSMHYVLWQCRFIQSLLSLSVCSLQCTTWRRQAGWRCPWIMYWISTTSTARRSNQPQHFHHGY